jgi:hypothetical protein
MTNLVYYFEMLAAHPEVHELTKKDVAELLGLGNHLLEGGVKDSLMLQRLKEIEMQARQQGEQDALAAVRTDNNIALLLSSNIGRLIGAILLAKERRGDAGLSANSSLVILRVLQDIVSYKVQEELLLDKTLESIPRVINGVRSDFEGVKQWTAYATRGGFDNLKNMDPPYRTLPSPPAYSRQAALFGDFQDFLDD